MTYALRTTGLICGLLCCVGSLRPMEPQPSKQFIPQNVSYTIENDRGTETKSLTPSAPLVNLFNEFTSCKNKRDEVFQETDYYDQKRMVCRNMSVVMGMMSLVATVNTLTVHPEDYHVPGYCFLLSSLSLGTLALDANKKYHSEFKLAQQKSADIVHGLHNLTTSIKTLNNNRNTLNNQEDHLLNTIQAKQVQLHNSTLSTSLFHVACEPLKNGPVEGQKIYNSMLATLKN